MLRKLCIAAIVLWLVQALVLGVTDTMAWIAKCDQHWRIKDLESQLTRAETAIAKANQQGESLAVMVAERNEAIEQLTRQRDDWQRQFQEKQEESLRLAVKLVQAEQAAETAVSAYDREHAHNERLEQRWQTFRRRYDVWFQWWKDQQPRPAPLLPSQVVNLYETGLPDD